MTRVESSRTAPSVERTRDATWASGTPATRQGTTRTVAAWAPVASRAAAMGGRTRTCFGVLHRSERLANRLQGVPDLRFTVGERNEGRLELGGGQVHAAVQQRVEEAPEALGVRPL